MTISFVGAASAEATSLTLPTHQAGDLIIMLAQRYNNLNPGTVPAEYPVKYISQRNGATVQTHLAVACKTAATAAETSGTWTNFNLLIAAVYRHSTNYLTIDGPMYTRGTGTSLIFSGKAQLLTSNNTVGAFGVFMPVASTWALAAVIAHLNTAGINTAPSGMSNRISQAGASNGRISLHDTGADVTSFTTATVTVAASTDWVTNVFCIYDTGVSKSSGGFRAVNIRGGADQ